MIPFRNSLDGKDRSQFSAAVAFLKGRLAEFDTVEWALRLEQDGQVERVAVAHVLNESGENGLEEPWVGAWRLIVESWAESISEDKPDLAVYDVRNRLHAGDRSGPVISAIVDLVRPRLTVQSLNSPWWEDYVRRPRRPKKVGDLLSARLTSGRVVDLRVLKLEDISEGAFLLALASQLEAAVSHGLDIAGRLGWDGRGRFLHLGGLNWAGYSCRVDETGRTRESDSLSEGIAPAVKLLHAVAMRIAELDRSSARSIVQQWRVGRSPVHSRLWAVTALDPSLVESSEVGPFLVGLDDYIFWRVDDFPEVAKLRATRFADLDANTQEIVAKRVCHGPARDLFPTRLAAKSLKSLRASWAVRELRRIEVAGGALPERTEDWTSETMAQFPELAEMKAEDGFPTGPVVRAVLPNPDDRFDTLEGTERLRALERALSSGEIGWMERASSRANDWLNQSGKPALILQDLESTVDGGDAFPAVWNRFGWAHRPGDPDEGGISPQLRENHAKRTLGLLEKVSKKTLGQAIEGISAWLWAWRGYIPESPEGLRVWLRVWPVAVEATNSAGKKRDEPGPRVLTVGPNEQQQSRDLDAINRPTGKLVQIFLEACPSLEDVPEPFGAGSVVREMREAMMGIDGESRLIVLHQLVVALPYFLLADREWTLRHLIAPLNGDNAESFVLWDAVARRTHFTDVLEIIGDAMCNRVADSRVSRETRQELVISLVVESLRAFRARRDPVVSISKIQQTLRSADDEVRAEAAGIPKRFVEEMSVRLTGVEEAATRKTVFESAAKPFLGSAWPQERSLATRGVSRALASLPVASGEAFGEAVDAIERFLVPFEALSMLDYGFDEYEGNVRSFSVINDKTKAQALLRLLDQTVSVSTDAVVPSDLAEALRQVRSTAPELVKSRIFRRLATVARR